MINKKFIPWHNTQSIVNGSESLNRMYNYLDKNSPLKQFINNNCFHLLNPLENNSGIPINYGDVNVLKNLPYSIKLSLSFNRNSYMFLPSQTGVYVLFLNNEVVQCGSCIRFSNRMQSHYIDAKNDKFIFGFNVISDYYWVPVRYTIDYVNLYAKNNHINSEQEQILTFFIQQEIRSLEQAYCNYVNPSNYKGKQVNIWHTNWIPNTDYKNVNTGKHITWVDGLGKIYTRSSISSATKELGFSINRIKTVAKVRGATLKTDKYGTVTVSIKGVIKNNQYPDLRSNTPLNIFVDISKLEPNMYYLYDSDINLLPINPFKTVKAVNKMLGLSLNYSGIETWCNYIHLIKSNDLSVYIVKNFTHKAIPIIITNLKDNTSKEYASRRAVCIAIGISMSIVLSRVVNNKVYISNDKISYNIQCKHLNDKIKITIRYNKSKKF